VLCSTGGTKYNQTKTRAILSSYAEIHRTLKLTSERRVPHYRRINMSEKL